MHKPQQVHAEKHHKKERSQAAMEFLLTYGWAIILVLVVIAALAYFGVLSPAKMLPGKCMFQIGFDCVDYTVDGTTQWTFTDADGKEYPVRTMTFNLVNRLGKTVYATGIKVVGKSEDYMCSEIQLEQCDSTENIFADGISLTLERRCISLTEICNSVHNLYLLNPGAIGLDCTDASKFLKISSGSKFKGELEALVNKVQQGTTLPEEYMNIYCLNLPKPGERMNAQIEITYNTGDSLLTHVAYGELSTTVS